MITAVFDTDGLDRALAKLAERMGPRASEGLDLTLEAIAARAKQTTTYTDRTGLLRNSTMSDGVTGTLDTELSGIVSFAARSPKGYLYGLAQEFGTKRGVREKRFIRDAIAAQDGHLIESAIGAAFRDAGFQVSQ